MIALFRSMFIGSGDDASKAPNEGCPLLELPSEVLLLILSHLDAATLCVASRTCWRIREVACSPCLWQRLPLTLFCRPRPPLPPASLPTLRVCSYRWPSHDAPRPALDALAWLGRTRVGRLELVGRGIDLQVVEACAALILGVTELSLHDVHVQDEWLEPLAQLRDLQVIRLDWLSGMTCDQVGRLAAACPAVRLLDVKDSPDDSRTSLQRALDTARHPDPVTTHKTGMG